MKAYPTEKIRNVVFVGHQGSGKTSLLEAILYNAGQINRMGRVEDGNTVSDYDEDEKARGGSVATSVVAVEFEDHKINVLDAPGYTDFQGEMKNAIRVADSVIVVIDAVAGVEVGTELAWEYAKQFKQPIIIVINKMDRENANFDGVMEQLRTTYEDYKFIPVMLPIGKEQDFRGVANVLTQKAYLNEGKERSDLPEEMAEVAEEARLALVEAAAEADDQLIDKYFNEEELTPDEVRMGMRKAARNHELNTVPVFVTSGTQNTGVFPLMEALLVYTSAPSVRRLGVLRNGEESEIEYLMPPQSDEGPLAAYVFKTTNDRFVGTLSYFRIFSGSIKADDRVLNTTRDHEEKMQSLAVPHGKEYEAVESLHVGDIGVVAKLNETFTCDTFASKGDPFLIVKPDFPAPLYTVALSPRTQADSAKMGAILTNLCHADPTLRWRMDGDTRQTVLEGMGEAHINLAISRAEKLGVGIETHMPKVPYRETVSRQAETTYRHKKQSGGAGQFAEISLRLAPNAGEGFVYETKIVGGAISQPFLPSIEKGIQQVLPTGVIAGFPVVDVRATVFDGKEHPVDSKDIAFQIAGREGFKEAFMNAGPVLMEPIMDVMITVPEAMMGDIMGDLNTRRGRVQGMDTVGTKSVVTAQVPLAEMMRYGNELRSMTGGRGIYTMTFSHYEQVPAHLQDDVIKANREVESEPS